MVKHLFTSLIAAIMYVIVHWRRIFSKVSSGKARKDFIRELTRMFRAYADSSAIESVALKAAMAMPALLLQKTSKIMP